MIEKRRSGRNTNKRKKYVDDVELNLSDDDNILANLPPDVAAEIKASGKKPPLSAAVGTEGDGSESASSLGITARPCERNAS